MSFTPEEFLALARRNPINVELLTRLRTLGLGQCHLTAGCLFQAVWNLRSGRTADADVKDYDVFYFDDADLSWEAEDATIRRVHALTADLGVAVEVRNQARVHLWYAQRFGAPYPPLRSARDGIDRYLVACTCVGIDVDDCNSDGGLYAPDSLQDLADGVLRINPRHALPDLFRAKAASYQARWPWLKVIDGASPGG
jgi:hypothetical protein